MDPSANPQSAIRNPQSSDPDPRKIFGPYRDGYSPSPVYADPLLVHRRLVQALEGEHIAVLEAARSENDLVAFAARDRLIPAARSAFLLKPFDPTTGQGITEEDVEATLNEWLSWMEKKKRAGRDLADLCAAIGGSALALAHLVSPDAACGYDLCVSLWLNIDRLRLQRAGEIALGIGAALNGGRLPRGWFDALARCEEEVDALMSDTNARRTEAQALARLGIR